jgi:hypothetical protein
MFKYYSNYFLEVNFLKLINQYSNYFDEYCLFNELQGVYSDTEKHKPPHEMLDVFFLKVC